ncbi:pyridoxamine 5'-phosphate oxidase family protein [Bosea sp. BIWAKO-01]|uniref:pyridoxamine 5'-phosphate oxidase family protein n=1 Tax=Bosea sp. BIWAKO-01 TaxID=506668 RepID=UPI0008532A95|nr:pyridoxamine 5'-phosphate oxidase family protein [Bosea sp. BIWAKO-01]GAU83585.1 iron-sulfur binding protein YPO1417 [Bosea sp. BIWAKO-01]
MDASPFHRGERDAQARAGLFSRGAGIRPLMPDQHRAFFPLLPYLFVGGLDRDGWPIATVLCGEAGFVQSPAPTRLRIAALPSAADPAAAALETDRPVGLLGLELTTRRRNRANGIVAARDADGLSVEVSQSFGNCAKYIQTRVPTAIARLPEVVEPLTRLDAAARTVIEAVDTLFIASSSGPQGGSAAGVDISHRGGRPGFVRIDGDVLTIPDFTGNSYFNTFGNLLLEPRAALLIPDFATGDIIQLQGETEIVWNGPELRSLIGSQRLWRFRVARAWRRKRALPFNWSAAEPAPTTLETGTWQRDRSAA